MKSEVRVHRYGKMSIWSIFSVKGKPIRSYQNQFTIRCKKEVEVFEVRAEAKGHLKELLKLIPDEFQKEFLLHIDTLYETF